MWVGHGESEAPEGASQVPVQARRSEVVRGVPVTLGNVVLRWRCVVFEL